MKKFRKFMTVVLTLAMVVGLFGVQSAMKAKAVDEIQISKKVESARVEPNNNIELTATYNSNPIQGEITWKVAGNKSAGTTITSGGMLTIGTDETIGTELTITAKATIETVEKTGTLKLTVVAMAGEAYDFTVWVNGKDIKANEAKKIAAAYYKTSENQQEHIAPYSGGKWNILVTDDTITTAEQLIALVDDKGKVNKNADAVKNGALLAKAKMKDGVITVQSNKNAGVFKVWVYETKKNAAKKTEVVNRNGVAPTSYTGIAKMAHKGIVLNDTVIAEYYTTTVKGLTKVTVDEGSNKTLYIVNKGTVAVDSDCLYEVIAPDTAEGKVTFVVSEDKKSVTIQALPGSAGTGTKGTSYKFTLVNKQSSVKISFTVTVKKAAEPTATPTPTPTATPTPTGEADPTPTGGAEA